MKKELDELDRRLLKELMENSKRSYRKIAKHVKMSPAAVIDRIRNLEEKGYILGYGCRVNYQKAGFEFMAIVEANVSSKDLLETEGVIAKLPNVAAVWDVTGGYDVAIILMCKNRDELSKTVKKILAMKEVEKTNTKIVLNVVKRLTEFSDV